MERTASVVFPQKCQVHHTFIDALDCINRSQVEERLLGFLLASLVTKLPVSKKDITALPMCYSLNPTQKSVDTPFAWVQEREVRVDL